MRGAGDSLSIGRAYAFYSARRGLTQTQLANLVGRRTDWLSKIERGERPLRNVELIAAVARVLRVSLPDLMGQPVLLEEENRRDGIPAIRDALMAPGQLSRTLFSVSESPTKVLSLEQSSRLVEFA
ncbi:hypothetical protein GCM10009836_58090 [Pseudonocardia ailaonensis]|uniref:HTH cro/C1-type domain-containing protein n=1 Tax=Pseudonocardia ailaonensis TaxID=367279 RepID=A0ABN2NHX3_9PSEU